MASPAQTLYVREHFLFPSTLFVTAEPYRVGTILGSCVAVCLYDLNLRIGGINHFMLPWWNGEGIPSPKYGDVAIQQLINKMFQAGSRRENIIAKIFGGAGQHGFVDTSKVGLRNIGIAEELLGRENIAIVSRNTGGQLGRKIIFETTTGKVMMKFLQPINIEPYEAH